MTTAHRLELTPAKTYATAANAIKAVENVFGKNHDHAGSADVRYVIVPTAEGRYFPLFLGQTALSNGVHHLFAVAN